jgi:5S rRNA maturation endonuclease (ribonuclease M5)
LDALVDTEIEEVIVVEGLTDLDADKVNVGILE